MKKLFSGLSRDTFILTFVSLFSDIATEMLYPILPIFLTQVLLAPASVVGIVEGIATATQNIVQGFSGTLADKLQQRKLLALTGYVLAAFSKPLIGISAVWTQVLGARFLDRLGTGIRSAPRDALIAGSAKEEYKGKAFGLEGIGDNAGAFIGPLLAIALLYLIHVPLRSIFLLAFIPGIVSAVLIALVKEPKPPASVSKGPTFTIRFPTKYWKYLAVTALFGIGNSSNAFLILEARRIGIPLLITILIYAFFNFVAAISSFPAGTLSDKIGRKGILIAAFAIFVVTYVGFAVSTNFILIGFLFILYGIFSGVYRGVGKAAAVDFVAPSLRASAVGWYATTIGISSLVASLVAGQLWVLLSPQTVFLYGSITGIIGIVLLLLMM